jgi:hypothetical protein
MKFYYFGGLLNSNGSNIHGSNIDDLESNGFDGVLFTYNPYQGDFFVRIANTINKNQKIKYMIAIRPHTISAQYLCMINKSMNEIQKNRLQINLIAGHIKPHEIDFNGFVGEVTDYSSVKDRTNYLIEYIKELAKMKQNERIEIPDYYVSCTNIFAYEKATELKQKIILPYAVYKDGYFLDKDIPDQTKPGAKLNIFNQKIMITINPVIRETQEEINSEFPKNKTIHTFDGKTYIEREKATTDTEYFTYDDFSKFIKKLESEKISEILINSSPPAERPNMFNYIKKYIDENSIN